MGILKYSQTTIAGRHTTVFNVHDIQYQCHDGNWVMGKLRKIDPQTLTMTKIDRLYIGNNQSIQTDMDGEGNPEQRAHGVKPQASEGAKEITAGRIAFQIAPRLNVGKRGMVDPMEVYRFLMEEDPCKAQDCAVKLHLANRQRQMLEDRVLKDAIERLPKTPKGRALVVVGDAWEHGVLGIAASKMIEDGHHYGPTILLAPDAETGLLSGSGRSVSGVDLHGALLGCEDLLARWGGHKMAAGLSLPPENLDAFRERLEKAMAAYPPETFVPSGIVDAMIPLESIDKNLVDSLAILEPYGYGNPKPNFAVAAPISGVRAMGSFNNHLEISLGNNGYQLRALWWKGADFRERLEGLSEALVIGKVDWSDYWKAPELVVDDMVIEP